VIDLHTHVLPGLDDGARSAEEALAMLGEMEAEGVRVVVATPHVRFDYPTTPAAMVSALRDVRAAAKDAGLAIEVVQGGELSLVFVDESGPDELASFALGGSSSVLLVEFPYADWPSFLERRVDRLRALGFTPVLAHPERNGRVADEPTLLRDAVAAGALVQLTAGSVEGRFGRRPAKCARALLEAGLAHVIASDAHGPHIRGAGLTAALNALGDRRLGHWLVEGVPAALLEGAVVPSRPPTGRSRSRLFGALSR
jgi:protein-tyrosine phosphatase